VTVRRSPWQPTPSLTRAVAVAAVCLAAAAVLGAPELVVLAAPFAVHGALGLVHRPRTEPEVDVVLGHLRLHEGQGTTSRLVLDDDRGVEHVARVAEAAPHVATTPAHGAVGALHRPGTSSRVAEVAVSPRRWGRRRLGADRVALTSRWAGFRVGPRRTDGSELFVLPVGARYDSRAEAPHPVGLVGGHRSRRLGGGTELAGIRPFVVGDRLRRIDWRVTLRERDVHVVTTRAEEDASVLLVVDGLGDLGRSEGVDGAASSLDLSVRAATALAEHHARSGDRISLRVVGPARGDVPVGAGPRHLHRLHDALSRIVPTDRDLDASPLRLGATAGTVVHLFSPMLHEAVVNAAALLVRRGVPVVVVDTLPPAADHGARTVEGLAWRMRLLRRARLLEQLADLGCPVVPWEGPGSLDDVLRQLARRARLPQVAR
jgi:uncharacterized protein (DUF58 family)